MLGSEICHHTRQCYPHISRVDGYDFFVEKPHMTRCAHLLQLCMSNDTFYEHIRKALKQTTFIKEQGYLDMERDKGDLVFKYIYEAANHLT